MTVTLETRLSDVFGFDTFREGQRDVCEHLIAGHSAAAVFPTGGGKSLCYQLPALALTGTTIVVSPLIALMKDQIDALARRGVAAARLDSSLTLDEFREVTRAVRQGELKLLYVAPERFTNERFRGLLAETDISLFAVDEAHCISEWGHNFRPDYLKLARFAKEAGAAAILALTATATPAVLDDICRFFEIEPDRAVRTPFHRANLELAARRVEPETRDGELVEWLHTRPEGGATIVYVTLQRTAMEVAERLVEAGFEARPYHAGLADEVRAETQDWFMASGGEGADGAIVVATIAFGMGIDKANIRAIAHYNLPKSLENYAQEIGRAGRDGGTSRCAMFVCDEDRSPLENFVYGDLPEEDGIAGVVEEMLGGEEEISIALGQLSSRTDVRPLVLRTLLTYLEIDGYLEERTPIYQKYQFAPLMPSAQILGHFEGAEHRYVHNVLAMSVAARKWFTIDIDLTAERTGTDRRRVIDLLDRLGERGFIEMKPSGLVHRYTRVRDDIDLPAVTADLAERMRRRTERDLERLDAVVAFAESPNCLASNLGEHFGEPLETPCGVCSSCRGEAVATRGEGERGKGTLDDATWQSAVALREEKNGEALRSPIAMARFLCGITSPKLSRARWTRHELFGAAETVPFLTVLERAEME